MRHFHAIWILLAVITLCMSGLAGAEVEVGTPQTFQLDAKPIDIATSADGKFTFILAEKGKIFILDANGKIKDSLTVSESVVSIGTSPTGDMLLLADSKDNTLDVVKLDFVVDIDIAGLPFKGPANAPVVIAVFSDYQ